MAQDFDSVVKKLFELPSCQLIPLNPDNFFHSDPGLFLGRDGSLLGLNLHDTGLNDNQLNKLITCNADLFSNIRYLDFSDNDLEFVTGLIILKNLIKVDLASNKIKDLRFLLSLGKLETVNLRCNCIEKIPHEIFNSGFDVKIHDDWTGGLILEGNPIQDPSLEQLEKLIARQKAERYEKIMREGVFSRNECRIQLIGSGGAGKTTLAKSLADREHLPNEPATQGMAIWETPLEDIGVKIWDFGGQEAMFSVHRLFIAGGDIFLIVLDSRHNESAKGWIEFVMSFSPNAKFIIILNKIDENRSFDVDRRMLRRIYPHRIKGFFRISANRKSDDAFLNFKSSLKKILSEYAKAELPVEFKSLLHEFERGSEAYVREEDFRKKFKDLGLSTENLDLAIDQLIRIGIVIRAELSKYGVVLIRSGWLAKNIYPLLEPDISLREEVENGFIPKNSLFKIWIATREQGVYENIDPTENELLFSILIEIMEKNDLCYKTKEDTLFIPNFLSAKSPEILNEIEYATPHLHFIFKCSFLPKLLFQHLHVEIGKRYNVIKRWKTGFIVTGANNDFDGKFKCIVTGDFFDRKINIVSFGRNRSVGFRDMYNLVKENLNNVGQMSHQEFIVFSMSNNSETQRNEYLLRFEDIVYHRDEGVDKYLCGEYRRSFSVADVLSGIHEDVVNNKQSATKTNFCEITLSPIIQIGNTTIKNREGATMSNNGKSGETHSYINYGNVGVQGPGGKASEVINSMNLLEDLKVLCESLKSEDAEADKITDLELAIKELSNQNTMKVFDHLKKIGIWGIERADKIGLSVVTAAIKSAMGY